MSFDRGAISPRFEIICLLAAPIFFRVLPESARWLAMKGKIEEAKKLLQKVASVNKRAIPPKLLEQVSFCSLLFSVPAKLFLRRSLGVQIKRSWKQPGNEEIVR